MNESFVVHAEYLIDIPEESKTTFYSYIIEYGIFNKEPNVTGFEKTFWNSVKRRIDKDQINYKITLYKNRLSAIESRIKGNKATEKDIQNKKDYEAVLEALFNKLNGDLCNNSNTTIDNNISCNSCNTCNTSTHDNDSDSDNEFDNDSDSVCEVEHCENVDNSENQTDRQTDFTKKIKELFPDTNFSDDLLLKLLDIKNKENLFHKEMCDYIDFVYKKSLDAKSIKNAFYSNIMKNKLLNLFLNVCKIKRENENYQALKNSHPKVCKNCGAPLVDNSGGMGISWFCKECKQEYVLQNKEWIGR